MSPDTPTATPSTPTATPTAREPIVTRALILSALGVAYALLARYGIALPPDVREAVDTLALAAVPVALAVWARRHTTPIADPRDAHGTPLVPDVSAGQPALGGDRADVGTPTEGGPEVDSPPIARP